MDIFTTLLYIHIAGGGFSLTIGLLIIFLEKGNKMHILLGNIFYWSMLISSIVAIPMSRLHPNTFLMLIGIWTIYMLITGKRFLKIKTKSDIKIFDWVTSIAMLITALLFVILGLINLIKQNYFGTVFIVFGLIGLLFSLDDIKIFQGKTTIKNFGLIIHIQRMMGAFIASVTAFIVVNNTILPSIIAWLLPTIIFAPMIIMWVRKWRKMN